MALFFLSRPDNLYITIAVAIYLDHGIRADNGTHSTTRAIGVACPLGWARDRLGGKITIFVGMFGDDDAFIRAYYYTQPATLASFSINYYPASHLSIYAQVSFQFDSDTAF